MKEVAYISLSILGFTVWSFCQISFVNKSSADNRLLFPMLVPFFASIVVCVLVFLWIYFNPASDKTLLELFQGEINWKSIFFASLGLALAYFFCTIAVSLQDNNAAIITAFNVAIIAILLLFIRYDGGKLICKFKATIPEIIGTVIIIIGVVIMKYEDLKGFFNK